MSIDDLQSSNGSYIDRKYFQMKSKRRRETRWPMRKLHKIRKGGTQRVERYSQFSKFIQISAICGRLKKSSMNKEFSKGS